MRVYFISGHLDLTEAEFDEHYKPQIDAAISASLKDAPKQWPMFIVGDARGADAMAIKYISSLPEISLTVFHMFDHPRHTSLRAVNSGGFTSDKDRDAAMTTFSTHDIAWVRPGRKKSGTAKNLKRRANLWKQ